MSSKRNLGCLWLLERYGCENPGASVLKKYKMKSNQTESKNEFVFCSFITLFT